VLIAEILERKPTEVIEREAIEKLISITASNQDHLPDRQKISVNALVKTTTRMLEEQDQSELNLGSFLRMYANAFALPTGQSSQPVERQQKVQALVATEQREPQPQAPVQDRKRKSPEEAGDDPSQQVLKKLNDVLSAMGGLAKKENAQQNPNSAGATVVEQEADGEEYVEEPVDYRVDLSRMIKGERRTSKQDSRQCGHRPRIRRRERRVARPHRTPTTRKSRTVSKFAEYAYKVR
jgi:hypothetical protein